MKIRLLVALDDRDYLEFFSNVLAEKYAEKFELSVCSSQEHFTDILTAHRYDIAMVSPAFAERLGDLKIQSKLTLLLCDGNETGGTSEYHAVKKYQRISAIVSAILEQYAGVADSYEGASKADVVAVWSPIGGVGKTTVALAYAAQRASQGKRVAYLDLEAFSSGSVYFTQAGKSISTIFGRMDNNAPLLLQSIRMEDSGSNILYFCDPENYDDISILTDDDVKTLVDGCITDIDELVIDLSSVCDSRTKKVLELADKVLLVTDNSKIGQIKLEQFYTQNNVFGNNAPKMILVANRGAAADTTRLSASISLPYIQSDDPVVIYKSLSMNFLN